jgi:excinuclease ABC subunit C
LLRDDKSLVFIRIDINSEYPTVSTTRRPLDDKAEYFGPYISAYAVRNALRVLRKIFPYALKKPINQKRASLDYHLGLDPGLEESKTTLIEYRSNLRKLIAIIKGRRQSIAKDIKKDMDRAAKDQNYELAARLRNQYQALLSLNHQVIFSDKEFSDISKDHALNELVELLNLKSFPRRIEGYDISHMQGTDVVASMVVFTNGISDKSEYRKFKTSRNINNDFANMNETISRRLKESNLKSWGKPSLILIDGGKGQLDAAIKARDAAGLNQLPMIGLAKREEQLVISPERSNVTLSDKYLHKLGGFSSASQDYVLINLPHSSNLIKLLQRIRDESHRFAVSYHSILKTKRQTSSILDEMPGIGEATKRKILRTFGSLASVKEAENQEIAKVIGKSKAEIVIKYLKS